MTGDVEDVIASFGDGHIAPHGRTVGFDHRRSFAHPPRHQDAGESRFKRLAHAASLTCSAFESRVSGSSDRLDRIPAAFSISRKSSKADMPKRVSSSRNVISIVI